MKLEEMFVEADRGTVIAATAAMDAGKRLRVQYNPQVVDDYRIVEVHAIGLSRKNIPCIRVFQTYDGSTEDQENAVGWRLIYVGNVYNWKVLDEDSLAPRQGYKPGDKGMNKIYTEVSDVPIT